jgi:two-component system chemotaxis response regulator CheB
VSTPTVDGVERLVAIGCSWGGLRAVSSVLDHLPVDLPVAVVVVQHRVAGPSALAHLLGPHSRWGVTEAEDKQRITPNTVCIAPGGYHLLVEETHFALTTEAPVRYSRPSIDVLFESAAEAWTTRVVAVVLSGANADGAVGLHAVLHRGGVGVVQEPSTAEREEMPRAAIATGLPLHVAAPAAIGPLLASLVSGALDDAERRTGVE